MMFTRGEVETLGLCALCKDLPVNVGTENEEILLENLESLGLLRKSRNGLSFRVSTYGYDYLQSIGLIFERDKTYLGKSKALYRRLEAAKTTYFFLKSGVDIFNGLSSDKTNDNLYVPSFLYRRQSSSNILGVTRMLGFFYLRDVMFVPYFISEDDSGIYTDVEEKTFSSKIILNNYKPTVLFTADGSLFDVMKIGLKKQSKNEKLHSETFAQAIEKFRTPVAFVTLDSYGLDAINIMSVKDYRTKLARLILMNDYESPTLKYSDGVDAKTKENLIIGIDSNVWAMKEVIRNSDKTTHIVLLPFQQKPIGRFLKGENARLHTLNVQDINSMLRISNREFKLSNEPYITKEGGYAYVPIVKPIAKAGRQKRTNIQGT